MSPYELEIRQMGFFRTALIAGVRPGQSDNLKTIMATPPADLKQCLNATGIRQFSAYAKRFSESDWCIVYFDYSGQDREAAAQALECSSPWWNQVTACLEPHPRAIGKSSKWTRMEWINHVHGADMKIATTVERGMVVTRLHPDKELWYRTLHQTNWPGVGDQMARSNIRHWTTFLIEVGPELYMFSYNEYIGSDREGDMKAMQADPVTQRWWTHTEPCLNPLPEMAGKGSWAGMTQLLQLP